MIVTCPRCFATYNVPEAALAVPGRFVRCSSCRFEWSETPLPAQAIAGLAPQAADGSLSSAMEDLPPIVNPHETMRSPTPTGAAPAEDPYLRRRSLPAATSPAAPVKRTNPLKAMGTGMAWVVFIVATLASLLVLLREPLGKRSTFLADFYEDVGLPIEGPDDWFRFEGVGLEKSESGTQLVLTVHGRIVNQSRRARDLPLLNVFWRSASGVIGPVATVKPTMDRLDINSASTFSGVLQGVNASGGGEVKVTFTAPQTGGTHTPPATPNPEPSDEHAQKPATHH